MRNNIGVILETSDILQLVILVILLSASAFFSSAETALMTSNKLKIRNLAENGDKRAKKVLDITANTDKMLSAILIGNNVVNLTASSLSTTLTLKIFGSSLVGIATGILTFLILVFGEITPKNVASKNAENMALAYIGVISVIVTVMTPVIFIVNKVAGAVISIFTKNSDENNAVTEEELRAMVEYSHEEGVIENEEKKMIVNVVDFGDTVAGDIMVPRVDMVMVDEKSSYEEILQVFREERYTRIPVYEETPDNVIGILNVKDFLLIEDKENFVMKELLREPLYTYEYKKTSALMMDMRKTGANIVIVLDEYGITAGLITLEDMLEEIVGEIRDEFDADEDEGITKVSDLEYLIDGSTNLDDINDRIGLELSSDEYESIGGLIMEKLGRIPAEGEIINFDNIVLTVKKMDHARIEKVCLKLKQPVTKEQ
ncbi:membrane protein, PF01595 family / transporter associated domain multi-domain protein [Lachnoanaerobaculum saburreum F0468]|uniref:Membrane protein, PF01595 family / transporter associated domain multi-domain protein n=1 Tax=Lachnoanaerobaculum saburreum F0468 TaxID=1095750 RepID=I0R6M4_9FIRM|nr:membrane protein, PF01595 family / transporter associated domain multi-domain protein [Lachnoanaerobaculum saburreum F0468]